MKICYSCFKEYDDEFDVCPFCGCIKSELPSEPIHLKPGTILNGRYLIGHSIGSGGFGILYKALDKKLESVVAIKEFFYTSVMTRATGQTEIIVSRKNQHAFSYLKDRFLAEARTMAKFGDHENIVNVIDYFEANGNAYIVMELLSGKELSDIIHSGNVKLSIDDALKIINSVGNALIVMHNAGVIHRDVAPDNIFVCSDDYSKVKLLDLGAALLQDNTDNYIDPILKPGYSPTEQYQYKNAGQIGPWSDVYALGATLYLMLTGIKPDESTNRKKEDTVVPPYQIDPNIPENLSNAIMKAMAVDYHIRYRTVGDFLKAINGEKKVVPLKKERRRRAARRFVGIIFACAALLFSGLYVNHLYQSKKEIRDLPNATISVWISAEKDSDEEIAVSSIIEDFTKTFPNVSVDLNSFSEEDYSRVLSEAAKTDNLPTVFESSGLSEDILNKSSDISDVLKSEQAKSCLFIEQYDHYYQSKKQIPLAIEVPMAVIINKGNVSCDYHNATFKSLDDFGKSVAIAVDTDYGELTNKNFTVASPQNKLLFMNNEKNECAVLLSSSRMLDEVKEALTAYPKTFSFYSDKKVYCRFCYEWSIGQGNRDEQKVAERLLAWMLGNNYQNLLMISRNSDGLIPINKECFLTKAEQKNYSPLKEIYKQFVFEK